MKIKFHFEFNVIAGKSSTLLTHLEVLAKSFIFQRFWENIVSRSQFWNTNTKDTAGSQALFLYTQFTNFKVTSFI